jgi:thiamine biosynthesis lipoprotein
MRASSPVTRRRFAALAGAAGCAFAAPSLLRAAPPVDTISGPAFGTGWRVTLPAGRDRVSLRAAIEALLSDIDRAMSPWRADSEISRFNAAPAGAHRLPNEVVALGAVALSIAEASGGTFDPTVGPLVARWGFGPIRGAEGADWRALSLSDDAIAKPTDGLTLDLCGIAKGHALDRIATLLASTGESDYVADLGGELLARGRHPSGRPWRVAIEDPRPGSDGAVEVIRLDGVAVATSGARAQSYRLGERRYSHIVDPLTGEPADDNLSSVTVVADDATTADGWATALAAAGPRAGPELARARGLDALFLIAEGPDLRRHMTGRFSDHIA